MIKWFKKRSPSWTERFWTHDALLAYIVRDCVPKEMRLEVRKMIQEATGTNWNRDDDFLAFGAGLWLKDKIEGNTKK